MEKLSSKAEVESLVKNDDRWTLLGSFMERVPQGTLRFADVHGVGPVVNDCDMDDKIWDDIVSRRSTTDQYKGVFFVFYWTSKSRRCESKVPEGDSLCALYALHKTRVLYCSIR